MRVDAADWPRDRVLTEQPVLVEAWRSTFEGRSDVELRKRPKPDVWWAVEYTVHTAEIVRLWHETVTRLLAGEAISFEEDGYPDADRLPFNEAEPPDALSSLEEQLASLRELVNSMHDGGRSTPLRWADPAAQEAWIRFGVGDAFAALVHALHDTIHHLDDVKRGLTQ